MEGSLLRQIAIALVIEQQIMPLAGVIMENGR